MCERASNALNNLSEECEIAKKGTKKAEDGKTSEALKKAFEKDASKMPGGRRHPYCLHDVFSHAETEVRLRRTGRTSLPTPPLGLARPLPTRHVLSSVWCVRRW